MKKIILILTTLFLILIMHAPVSAGDTLPNIMLTGYWNPTGRMIASFCTDTFLNPSGWIGENWEGLGFNIYSFFPSPETYTGMFEVDYQDTWEDFWNVTDSIHPIAILSFGLGPGPWEIEYNARNLYRWERDYIKPYQPTPSPPDSTEAIEYVRHPTIPITEIEDAVNKETPMDAWIDLDGDPEAFLCEYIAYLGMWYKSLHNSINDTSPCMAAGFIHVNDSLDSLITLEDVIEAAKVTLREVIKALEAQSIDEAIKSNLDKISLTCYPNPNKTAMTISFNNPAGQNVTLNIYNMKGKCIKNIFTGYKNAGKHSIKFNGTKLPAGAYFYRIKTEKSGVLTKKMILLK